MEVIVGILFFVGVAVLWCFFNFPPEYAEKRALKIFNWSVVGVCVMLCLVLLLNIKTSFAPNAYEKFGPILSVAGCLGIEITIFFVFFLLRNFWIFKAARAGGSRGGW